MLKNASGKISRVFQFVVLILMAAQILVGCAWGFLNCSSLQAFPDTAELVKLSGTLKITGDTGILYPALLIVIRTLTVNGPVLFYHVMYLLQIVLALVSWFVFARNVFSFDSKYKDAFFALAVVTNPYAMQVHLAVLEYSFVSSFVCLLVSYQIRFMREWKDSEKKPGLEKAMRDISVTSLFWLASALTRKEFIFIGSLPVLALLITIVKRFAKTGSKKALNIASPIILVLAFTGIICMSDSLFRSGERLSPLDSVKRSLYYRIAWTEDLQDRFHWPEYLVTIVDEDSMIHFMNDPGIVRPGLADCISEKVGTKETSDYFLQWARIRFSDNKKGIVLETASDFLGYLFVPAKTEYVLKGNGYPGFVAGNYDVMKQHTPRLTKVYLRYFSIAYRIMLICFAICLILEMIVRDKKDKSVVSKKSLYLPAAVIAVFTSIGYTFLGCNVFDHRKALFTTCMWIALFVCYSMNALDNKTSED